MTGDAHMVAATAVPSLVARWAHLYSGSKVVSTAVTFLHFAGVLLGGGFAVVADRAGLRVTAGAAIEPKAVSAAVHRWVIGGLAAVFVSGFLIMFSDLHTYTTSVAFWIKMGLVALLLINGYRRVRAEDAVRSGAVNGPRRLRRSSVVSLVLWFTILLASTVLNASA